MTTAQPTPDQVRQPSAEPDLGRMSFGEFVALLSQIVAIVAISIDAMLPTLGDIARDLGIENPNDRQLIISMFILGMSISPLIFGVAADAVGRRPVLFVGLGIYVLGSLICLTAVDFTMLIVGRLMAGCGAAAPRILALTVVRDRFEGRSMAKVMSFVMTVFILVPAIAPSIGLGLAQLGGWRAVFIGTMSFGLIVLVWAYLRLPETLAKENRRPVELGVILDGLKFALLDRWVMGWTVATGMVFGAFLAYLASAQQVLDETYGLGGGFVLVFAVLALTVGISSLINSQIVMRLGMRRLVRIGGVAVIVLALVFLAFDAVSEPFLPLWAFLAWCLPTFLSFGLLFGNLNSLAMTPLGKLAGLGAAFVLTLTNLIAVGFAQLVAMRFNGEPAALIEGFIIANLAALIIGAYASTGRSAHLLDHGDSP